MNPLLRSKIIVALLIAGGVANACARPIDFREVSLLVRTRQSERSITSEVSSRKLLHKITPEEEAKLRAQGASDSLIESLRNTPAVPESETPAAEPNREGRPTGGARARNEALYADTRKNDVHVFDVAYEHPINLSFWGGPDREFVFHRSSDLEGDARKVEMIDPNRSYTHYATYIGSSSPGFVSLEQNYSAATAHTFARPLSIDTEHPVRVPGVRYSMYPVYSSGDVALYYIASVGSSSARVAVQTHR